jgi:hypothetical protein
VEPDDERFSIFNFLSGWEVSASPASKSISFYYTRAVSLRSSILQYGDGEVRYSEVQDLTATILGNRRPANTLNGCEQTMGLSVKLACSIFV